MDIFSRSISFFIILLIIWITVLLFYFSTSLYSIFYTVCFPITAFFICFFTGKQKGILNSLNMELRTRDDPSLREWVQWFWNGADLLLPLLQLSAVLEVGGGGQRESIPEPRHQHKHDQWHARSYTPAARLILIKRKTTRKTWPSPTVATHDIIRYFSKHAADIVSTSCWYKKIKSYCFHPEAVYLSITANPVAFYSFYITASI